MKRLIDLGTDGHVHTCLCHHAYGTMQEYVEAAIEKGLKHLVFLEHLEMGVDYFESTWLSDDDFQLYLSEGQRLKSKYRESIRVSIGVEVGFNPLAIENILRFLENHSWDRVGLSYHFYNDNGRHVNMLSRKQANIDMFTKIGVSKVLSRYFEDLIYAVDCMPVQVLCHLDAVLRFHPDVNFDRTHQDQICLLLDKVAQKQITLEINTSGFVHRGEPYPSKWIIQKAISKGISLCLGSDAHRPGDVGRYFDRVSSWIKPL